MIKNEVLSYYKQDRIAFFVGAGVSAVSEYPKWSELVMEMAEIIGYPVMLKDEDNNKCLSSEEFLKIPQMLYNMNEEEYMRIIRERLDVKKETNDIHTMIMRVKPNHIITTNYDTLLEDAAQNAGMAYSVINVDDRVATAPTRNYILKVHGDFERNNIVLREDNYLNYENDFVLLDNLMKSIISTHLVIFIGYGLGDYNIKLIMNWVKNAQREGFINPVFIHSGKHKLTDNELDYYNNKGLSVIDSNLLVPAERNEDYEFKYSKALSLLFDQDIKEKEYRDPTWIVDYYYKLFVPLADVKYLRRTDIDEVLAGVQLFHKNYVGIADLKCFIDVFVNRDKLSIESKQKMDFVIDRLHNSGIRIKSSSESSDVKELIKRVSRGTDIDYDVFGESYQQICSRIDLYSNSVVDRYNKAYDLFLIGRYDDAIETYKGLITDCYSEKRWFLYFYSHINLYYLRQTKLRFSPYLNDQLEKLFGSKYEKIWSDEDIENIRLSHFLSDIPAEIREYGFLKRITDINYYRGDYATLLKNTFNIEKNAAKGDIVNNSKIAQSMKTDMMDAINYIYCNRIAFIRYSEHMYFVKVTLREYIKTVVSLGNSHISFHDMLLMIRNYKYEDINVFYNYEDGKKLLLSDEDLYKFYQYITDLIDYFTVRFNGDLSSDRFVELFVLENELEKALLIASYYVIDDEIINSCMNYISNNDKNLIRNDDVKYFSMLKRFTDNAKSPDVVMPYWEKCILDSIHNCKDESILIELAKKRISLAVNEVNSRFPNYKSDKIKQYLGELSPSMKDLFSECLDSII